MPVRLLKNRKAGILGEYGEATVMFADIPNFQFIVPHCQPKEIVQLLNDLFHRFDRLVVLHGVSYP